MRDSFLFYRSFFTGIKKLSDANQFALYKAIFEYALDGTEPILTDIEAAIFEVIRPQLDANNKKYGDGCKGGRPPKKTSGFKGKKPVVKDKKTSGNESEKPNENENDNENDNENERDVRAHEDFSLTQKLFNAAGLKITVDCELSEKDIQRLIAKIKKSDFLREVVKTTSWFNSRYQKSKQTRLEATLDGYYDNFKKKSDNDFLKHEQRNYSAEQLEGLYYDLDDIELEAEA